MTPCAGYWSRCMATCRKVPPDRPRVAQDPEPAPLSIALIILPIFALILLGTLLKRVSGVGEEGWRGTSGPLHVQRGRRHNPLYDAFIRAIYRDDG